MIKKQLLNDFKRSIIAPAGANKKQIADTAVDQLFNGLYINNKYSMFTVSGSTTSSVAEIFLPKNSVIRDVIAVCKEPIYGMTGSMGVELYIDAKADDYDDTGNTDGTPGFNMTFNDALVDALSGSDAPGGAGTITLVSPGTGSETNFVQDTPDDGWFAVPSSNLEFNFAGSNNQPHGYMLEDTTIKAAFHLIDNEANMGDVPQSQSAFNSTGQIDLYVSYLDLY
jgi:hypothetical protein